MSGDELKKVLKIKGVQLNKLADSLNITPQNLNSKLRGQDIGAGFLKQIAVAINISLYDLLEGNANDSAPSDQMVSEPSAGYGNPSLFAKLVDCMESKEKLYVQLVESEKEKVQILKEVAFTKQSPQ